MYQNKSVTAVILAAGSGNRMGLDINKVYISANNSLIVQYSLNAFDRHPYIDEIVVTVRPQDLKLFKEIITRKSFSKPVRIVFGGETRGDSVNNAIVSINSDIVLVHDAARPLIKQQYITDCVEAMENCAGAIIAVRSDETISSLDNFCHMQEIPQQDTIYLAQTPQCFHTKILRECHNAVYDKSKITDDSSLLERAGYTVKILPGDRSNIKITTPVDITLAEVYLDLDKGQNFLG